MKKSILSVVIVVIAFFAGIALGAKLMSQSRGNPLDEQVARLQVLESYLGSTHGLVSGDIVRERVVGAVAVEMSNAGVTLPHTSSHNRRLIYNSARWALDNDLFSNDADAYNHSGAVSARCIVTHKDSQETLAPCLEQAKLKEPIGLRKVAAD